MEDKTQTRCHIHIGDCRDVLRTLPEQSVYLVVTSPPYNLNLQYGKWNDQMPFEEYMRLILPLKDRIGSTLERKPDFVKNFQEF